MSGSRLVTTAEHNAFLLKRADPVTHLTPQKCAVPSGVKSHAPRSASVTMTCIFSEQNSEVLESPELGTNLGGDLENRVAKEKNAAWKQWAK